MSPVFNHVGVCVTDMARSRRFYEEVLGFDYWRELEPPDAMVSKLIDLEPPIGVTAVYLRQDAFVLELMYYADAGHTLPRHLAS